MGEHRTAAGEGRDFDESFRALFLLAYRVALRITGDRREAEDVAAEALTRAYAAWWRVSRLSYRDAWVLRVATNVAIDTVRKRRTTSTPVPDAIVVGADADAALRVDVRALLATLSRRQRDVLALRYLADLRDDDVAHVLGITVGNVKKHANRGVERLRRRLGDQALDAREANVAI